ncbi:MAG: methylmalonyl-CoA mutase family protein [Candidatus Cyclobacteriaceae bacterium M2_1C_046]
MDFKEPLTFDEFKKATYEAWKEQALKELKKDNLESLQWKNKDNILLYPYYDPKNSVVREAFHHQVNPENDYAVDARWWENRQEFLINNSENYNKSILESLEGGADGIVLKAENQEPDLEKILKDVKPEYCSISYINTKGEPATYFSYVNKTHLSDKINGEIYWEDINDAIAFVQEKKWHQLPEKIRCFGIIASTDDEVVNLLLQTKQLLDKIPADRHSEIVNRMSWRVAVSEDYFQSIAKIKSLRNLLFQIFSAYSIKLNLQDLFIYAYSPVYKNEKFAPHENMLKSTTAAMAAIIGGCNAVYVQPENIESPMQRRVARNVSLILKEESHLSKNLDPVAGSYFLESLIDQTSKHDWQKFQDRV